MGQTLFCIQKEYKTVYATIGGIVIIVVKILHCNEPYWLAVWVRLERENGIDNNYKSGKLKETNFNHVCAIKILQWTVNYLFQVTIYRTYI